jgi:hypothetical protein
MALPSFPPDDPASLQAESGLADPAIRARVKEGAARALRGERGVSESEGLRRLSAIPGFTDALAEIEGPSDTRDL